METAQPESGVGEGRLLETLRTYWGYDSFLPLQAEAMSCVLRGRDSVVVLPTGGGKSLCFQAPAMCLPGLARGRLAADLADEGPGRRPAQLRRAGGVCQQHAVGRRSGGEWPTTCAPAGCGCCTWRPSGC